MDTPYRPDEHVIGDAYRLLTSEEAARYLRISTVSLWRQVKANVIQPIKVGRLVRFDIAELDAVIELLKLNRPVQPQVVGRPDLAKRWRKVEKLANTQVRQSVRATAADD